MRITLRRGRGGLRFVATLVMTVLAIHSRIVHAEQSDPTTEAFQDLLRSIEALGLADGADTGALAQRLKEEIDSIGADLESLEGVLGRLQSELQSAQRVWSQKRTGGGGESGGLSLFREHIRPVLECACLSCHGGSGAKGGLDLSTRERLLAGGDSGPSVVPGDPEASPLWNRVAHLEQPGMPYLKPKLSDETLARFAEWIRQGAAYDAPLRTHSSSKEDLWSLRPVVRPDIPEVNSAWVRDLHGLPPTPEEVEAFVSDPAEDAYDRLVERLLDSPRYGERWGRHWLDVVRYADTHGYDKDKRRPNAWPYRDYVIESLNADKPYALFIEEQIAGDILFPELPEGVVATGFIAAGPWDFVGHVELREGTKDKMITRSLDRDDMVTSTFSTFMSLTVGCARCHDHKFDPISREDYYSLQSVFAGVDRAERFYDPDPGRHALRRRLSSERKVAAESLAAYERAIREATGEELAALDARLRPLSERLAAHTPTEKSPSNGYHSGIEPQAEVSKWVQVVWETAKPIDKIVLVPARPTDFPDTPGFGFPRRYKVEGSPRGDFSDAVILADHSLADFPNPGTAPFEVHADRLALRAIRVTATRLWERTNDYVFALAELQAFSDGANAAALGTVSAQDSIDSGRWHTRFLVDGYDSRALLKYPIESGPSATELEALRAEVETVKQRRRALAEGLIGEELKKAGTAAGKRMEEIDRELAKLPQPSKVYAAANDFRPDGSFTPAGVPRPVQVLARGDVTQPVAEASPRAIRAIREPSPDFYFSNPSDEGPRRAALAKWISHPKNPLTWRSIVNRAWHYHFGRGIVDTPNDFGHMGGQPSHPELLDWLAGEFLAQGGSLKALHRLILRSAAYRQVCSHDEDKARLDSDNRFLWRMNRSRLDAESIRDSVLYVSGKLDFTMGGPGFDLFDFKDDHSPHYSYETFDVDNPGALRRTVYRFIVRSAPDPFVTCLDGADPSQSVPARNITLTALQALSLLNNPFMVRQAKHLADRLESESEKPEDRIRAAHQLTLGRPPTEQEQRLLAQYAEGRGLPAVCRLLFNCNEFVFVD
ncbi:MAG: DUF1553 domain-containing protein [Candidatus Omnitrophica bacterium]|nr:DUF1553 domain-containing protein [Candidatus Omnitrophota bacterium]